MLDKEKILVTGGAGFIGSHLVDALLKENFSVIVVDNLTTGLKTNLNPQAEFFLMDIGDPQLEEIFKNYKIKAVFHLAAQINLRESVKNPLVDAQTNILGSLNLLENCKKYKIGKVIFSSTGGALYGEAEKIPTPETYLTRPISPYGVAKLAIENYIYYYHQVFALDYVVLRYANVYGPRQNSLAEAGVVSIFVNKIIKGEQPLINGDGQQTRDYVFVEDVVRANLLALARGSAQTYNVATSQETNVNEIFHLITANFSDKEIKEIHGQAMAGEQKRSCLAIKKIKKDLAWQPAVNLKQGIKMTVDWFITAKY